MKTLVNLFFSCYLLSFGSVGWAQGAAPPLIETKVPAKSIKKKRVAKKDAKPEDILGFAGSVLLTKNNSLYDHLDSTYYDGLNYEVDLGYKWKSGNLLFRFSYDQNLRSTYEDRSDLNDGSITYSSSAIKLDDFGEMSLTPNLTLLVPLSKKSTRVEELQTALIVGLNLGYEPKQKLGIGNLSLGVALNIGKSFHRYDVDVNGGPISSVSSNQKLIFGYKIESFSINLAYTHKSRWSYHTNVNEGFELSEELDYEINKTFAIALGHTNSGAALKSNGQDTNFAIVNENDSVIYFQGAFSF